MKLLIRTLVFQLFCIIVFACLYIYLSDQFQSYTGEKNKNTTNYLDFLILSITIQAGIGINDVYPISYYSKTAVIIQHCLKLLTNVVTLYIFTL